MLLLHGFPDSPIAWGPVIDRLDTSNLRLIVPYLRGHGPTRVLRDEVPSDAFRAGYWVLSDASSAGC